MSAAAGSPPTARPASGSPPASPIIGAAGTRPWPSRSATATGAASGSSAAGRPPSIRTVSAATAASAPPPSGASSPPTAPSTGPCFARSAPGWEVAPMRHDRDPYRDHQYIPDTFWLVVAALLFAASGLVWLIGQVAAILFGAHEHLPVRLVDMLGVLLRLPGTWDDPAKAWPPDTWPLLPGPVGMYAAAVLTFWLPALAYGLLVRLLSPRARRQRKQRGARWASLWQLRRLLVVGPRRGRIILGRRDRIRDRLLGRLYLAVEQCHSVLAFGPPGSFKTHGLVIPAILEWQGNLVTTSIKPDVLRATCAHRASLGAVWVYDPLGQHPADPAGVGIAGAVGQRGPRAQGG